MKRILYFAPHQDDELLVMGLDICKEIKINKENVHVYLCTDGAASAVKGMLKNGSENCILHKGKHCYDLTTEEFTKARDREFILSCESMGVKKENIHILKNRKPDQGLKYDDALAMLREAINGFDDKGEILIRTIAPYRKKKQQTDHSNLGLAAQKLFEEGEINEAKLIIENPEAENCLEKFSELSISVESFDDESKEKVKKAAASYNIWEPERGFYAVGYHSVLEEFESYLGFTDMYYTLLKR